MASIAPSISRKLTDGERKTIALQALAGIEPISALAERNGVSRPTVYRQMKRADAALDELFSSTSSGSGAVLFMLPVTRQWLEQVILALTLVGHASFRASSNSCTTCWACRSHCAPFTTSISRPRSEPYPSTPASISRPFGSACPTSCFRDRNPCSPALMSLRPTAICSPP